MKKTRMINVLIGVAGLFASFWINFFIELPLIGYLVVVPIICLPSIIIFLQGLSMWFYQEE
ncbi:hypothetical protein KO525_10620 [Psychrosphaera sp. B3R10]|uniref:hypothetical protein n=1 Tax=unclassified Psychrosphaera TaxID=2641570 RepID=UPI001C09C505|nr:MULTISPECIES: hypothetical protein [unclassified Psychrosphaera]MBU2882037.1 hypothetical protein [Psychrosphaera sp. I2R16]MBU2989832.1 hypothetical protein [Psychrosphaera sp. B3R10]MDO6721152.1 hypothetical protein [Psychrosphaera sp. 1_MG-2023]